MPRPWTQPREPLERAGRSVPTRWTHADSGQQPEQAGREVATHLLGGQPGAAFGLAGLDGRTRREGSEADRLDDQQVERLACARRRGNCARTGRAACPTPPGPPCRVSAGELLGRVAPPHLVGHAVRPVVLSHPVGALTHSWVASAPSAGAEGRSRWTWCERARRHLQASRVPRRAWGPNPVSRQERRLIGEAVNATTARRGRHPSFDAVHEVTQ